MLKNRRLSQMARGIIAAPLCALFLLLSLAACQSAPATAQPMSTATAQSALIATDTTVPEAAPVETQPVVNGPVLLGEGISLRKVMEVGPNYIRLVRNPVDGDVYLLDSAGAIYRISDISTSASRDQVASLREIKGQPTGHGFWTGWNFVCSIEYQSRREQDTGGDSQRRAE